MTGIATRADLPVFLYKDGGSLRLFFRTAAVSASAGLSCWLDAVVMAARVAKMLGPHLADVVLVCRSIHCSTVNQAGSGWRLKYGLPLNPSTRGPLIDQPDWSFADGRPAPPMKGYTRRREKNKEFASRVAMISAEMDRGIEKWKAKQREREQRAEEKRCNRLQPKGGFLPKTPK